jgi:SAM-dependent methyltransferase
LSEPASALERYYAARASEYERIYAKPERQRDLRRLEALLPPLFARRRVLEIACGTGYWTRFIARDAAAITAIDASDETLAIAARKALPPERVRLLVADAYALPDSLGTFDAAFAGFWWSHVPRRDRARFLRGLDARLAPGAIVALVDNRYVEGSSTPIAERDAAGDTYQRRRLDDGSEHLVLKNFPSEAELRADFAAVGRDARYVELEYYWVLTYAKA